jgi:hypothetical protein
MERSHPQLGEFPAEHCLVTLWATPAAEMAWRKAASRVPAKNNKLVLNSININNY